MSAFKKKYLPCSLIIVLFIVSRSYEVSRAYSINSGAADILPQSPFDLNVLWNGLPAPIRNFIDSLGPVTHNAVGTAASGVHTTTLTSGNLFKQFDDWFYGFAGFRISKILAALFGFISLMFDLAKRAVDWLLGLVR